MGFVLHYAPISVIENILCVMAGKALWAGVQTSGLGLVPVLCGPPSHVPRPGAVSDKASLGSSSLRPVQRPQAGTQWMTLATYSFKNNIFVCFSDSLMFKSQEMFT